VSEERRDVVQRALPVLAIATGAAVGIAAAAWFVVHRLAAPAPATADPDAPPPRSPYQVYEAAAAGRLDLETEWADGAGLRELTGERLGQPLVHAGLPGAATPLGLTTVHVITPDTVALVARVSGELVLVLIDAAEDDTRPIFPSGTPCEQFRRTVAGLVCYEVTPLGGPSLLKGLGAPPPGG